MIWLLKCHACIPLIEILSHFRNFQLQMYRHLLGSDSRIIQSRFSLICFSLRAFRCKLFHHFAKLILHYNSNSVRKPFSSKFWELRSLQSGIRATRSQLGKPRTTKARNSRMAKTRSNSSPEHMQLDLATLNEKYQKSESSQGAQRSNRLEKFEGQMAFTA